MKIHDDILNLITNTKLLYKPLEETSGLYRDLGFDSLEFIQLLIKIEEIYPIEFSLTEMNDCLQINQLIATVERKLEENEHGKTLINESVKSRTDCIYPG